MLEGLEITEVLLSDIQDESTKLRIDSQYYTLEMLEAEAALEQWQGGYTTLGEITSVFRKGIFDIKADSYVESGVPFVRISNLQDGLIKESNIIYITPEAHEKEAKTGLVYGDIVLSKTAYAAAAFVNLPQCNVSQDTVAVKISPAWQSRIDSAFLVAYLNSKLGNRLLTRQFQGNIQMHLSLPDGEKIKVPLMSQELQKAVASCFTSSIATAKETEVQYAQAETLLLDALGLATWQPPTPLAYEQPASAAFASGRMDAEYYQPKNEALLAHLRARGAFRLGDRLASPIQRGISPDYVEEGGDLTVINSKHVGRAQVELHDNRQTTLARHPEKKGRVRQYDVLLNSTGRDTIGRCQCVLEEVTGVVDNHVAIIRPVKGIDPVYLACFLNSPPGQQQTEQYWTGSSGQIELSIDSVEKFVIWDAPVALQSQIRETVEAAHTARRQAKRLLEAAKRAVEVAIEQGEAAALAFLETI